MTVKLSGQEIGQQIVKCFPGIVVDGRNNTMVVESGSLFEVARFLKETPELDFNYLNSLTAVDYVDYLEVVYHLTSLNHNHSIVLKTRCYDLENPTISSVIELWRGADFQEQEVFDLFGITFAGHPNMRRIFLWEGFEGHPLRKDYL